ncbi:hypothetical protein CPLU01_11705 [Colletotrichum plurivorum]|uniref:Uncharacterized protein n=1 Tax=Colletotrichum plurivorum TaxID=2175906 RepID=A0A8H6K1A3_9PEZI|nr:hypothetical protein CPLU01_11705 [Colletotrichum plurivorum]
MGLIQKVGHVADKVAMSMVNSTAMGDTWYKDSINTVSPTASGSSKGRQEPPPRVSKMTWQETLDAQKAAKEKEEGLIKEI